MSDKTLLTTEELMERLKVSRSTIDRLLKEGLPRIKIGRQNRFIWDKVWNWFLEYQKK